MPNPGLSDATIRQTIAALKQAGGNRTHAATLLNINPVTMSTRIRSLQAKPKWRDQIPPAKIGVSGAPSPDPTGAKELEKERKRRAYLEAQVERLRRTKARPVAPAKKRDSARDELVVAFPDVHGSSQDRAAVAAFLGDLRRLNPSRVVGLGDLIDCGGFLAQHHVMGFVAETEYSFEQDTADANSFLDGVQEAAPNALIELLEGNHDQRPEKWAVTAALRNRMDADFLRARVSTEEVLGLKKRGIQYFKRSEYYDGLPVQGAIRRGKVVFTHGLQRGGGSGVTGCARMLDRFGTNVCFGHTHWLAQLVRRSVSQGTIGAWNLGCLSRLQPLWLHADPSNWTHAYGIFIVAKSGAFLALPVPIVNGVSLLPELKI